MSPRHFHFSRADLALNSLAKLADAVLICAGLAFVELLYINEIFQPGYLLSGLGAALAFVVAGEFAGIYRPWRGETPKDEPLRILAAWLLTVALMLGIAYAAKVSGYFSRVTWFGWFVLTPIVLLYWRRAGRRAVRAFFSKRTLLARAVVWGSGELGAAVAERVRGGSSLGVRLLAYLEDNEDPCIAAASARSAGQLEDLVQQAQRGDVDIVYVALPLGEMERARQVIDRLSDSTVAVYFVPDLFTTHLAHGRWASLGDFPIISVFDSPIWGLHAGVKRGFDIAFSGLALIVLSVPMALIALGVKLSSPGPVLFKQRRYGLDGKEIRVWKFRTMRVADDGAVVRQATRGDPRVTAFGSFLRETSLDELPQFFNVLSGQMSVVGPRPHAVAHNEEYRSQIQGYMRRHKVKPGITGWAQVNGWRGETETPDKMERRVEHDLWYLRNWSLWLDLKIIWQTIFRGFRGKNAY